MSADNGAILRKKGEQFELCEYNASTGHEYHYKEFNDLETALAEAEWVATSTEYGLTLSGFEPSTAEVERNKEDV